MADQGKKVDIIKLLSLTDDMVKVLKTKKEGDALVQSCDSAITIMSSFLSSSHDLRTSIEGTSYFLLLLTWYWSPGKSVVFWFASANRKKIYNVHVPEVIL
jgi:hypothetical protein